MRFVGSLEDVWSFSPRTPSSARPKNAEAVLQQYTCTVHQDRGCPPDACVLCASSSYRRLLITGATRRHICEAGCRNLHVKVPLHDTCDVRLAAVKKNESMSACMPRRPVFAW